MSRRQDLSQPNCLDRGVLKFNLTIDFDELVRICSHTDVHNIHTGILVIGKESKGNPQSPSKYRTSLEPDLGFGHLNGVRQRHRLTIQTVDSKKIDRRKLSICPSSPIVS